MRRRRKPGSRSERHNPAAGMFYVAPPGLGIWLSRVTHSSRCGLRRCRWLRQLFEWEPLLAGDGDDDQICAQRPNLGYRAEAQRQPLFVRADPAAHLKLVGLRIICGQ